jgi:hypothetical protein
MQGTWPAAGTPEGLQNLSLNSLTSAPSALTQTHWRLEVADVWQQSCLFPSPVLPHGQHRTLSFSAPQPGVVAAYEVGAKMLVISGVAATVPLMTAVFRIRVRRVWPI